MHARRYLGCSRTARFAERTPLPHFYQTHLGEKHFVSGKVTVLPFGELCRALDLP